MGTQNTSQANTKAKTDGIKAEEYSRACIDVIRAMDMQENSQADTKTKTDRIKAGDDSRPGST